MPEDKFWLLVSLQLSGEATEEDKAAFAELIREQPELGLRFSILSQLWEKKHPGFYRRKEEPLMRHLQRLSNHLSEPVLQYETNETNDVESAALTETHIRVRDRRRYFRLWWFMGASSAAAVITFLVILHPWGTSAVKNATAQNTVSTKPGSKSKIQLPDGSQVWLNSDSRLTYNEHFHGAAREVQLSGEAYFDIIKDKEHPFIIHVNPIDIKVLGTVLNVRSYTNEKNTQTELLHGSVEITIHNSPDKKIILQPNEKLVVPNNNNYNLAPLTNSNPNRKKDDANAPIMTLGKVHFRENDSTAMDVLWVKNKLAFDGEFLDDVARKIERWYDVKVSIKDERLKKTIFSGVFEDESLRQVMEALRITGNLHYTINRKEVIIKP